MKKQGLYYSLEAQLDKIARYNRQGMQGRHCAHVSADDAQGENVLGTIVREFVLKTISL